MSKEKSLQQLPPAFIVLFALLCRRHSGCWVRAMSIFGYSDSNWVPALQDILNVCGEKAAMHNHKFSTDANPKTCKTKCMVFRIRQRKLHDMFLTLMSVFYFYSMSYCMVVSLCREVNQSVTRVCILVSLDLGRVQI